MLDDLRIALRRTAAPSTLLVALVVALLETLTGFTAGALAFILDPYFAGLSVIHTVLGDFVLPFVLWLPVASFALAGFYAVLAGPRAGLRDSLATFVHGGRRHLRRYLVAATAGTVVSLGILLAVWSVLVTLFLAASTGFDYYRYLQGARFAANPLHALSIGGLFFGISALLAGAMVAYLGPFVVLTDRPATRLPLASLRFLRRYPRRAAPPAVAATLLFAIPPHLGRVVFDATRPDPGWLGPPPAEFRAQLLTALAGGLVVAVLASVFARALAGPWLVQVCDRHVRRLPTASEPLLATIRPGPRTTAALFAVLLVGSATAGVRIADVHPQNHVEPGIELDQPANALYRDSLALTERAERRETYTTSTRYPNGTLEKRVTWRIAWDTDDHRLVVALGGARADETGVSTTYYGEGVLARRTTGDFVPGWNADQFEGLVRTNAGWIVLPLPGYGMSADPEVVGQVQEYHTNETARMRVAERHDDRLVVAADGRDAALLSQYSGSETHDLRNATFRATIDPRTGYLRRVSLRGTLVERNQSGAVESPSSLNVTATYRDVGETHVERPALGGRGVVELVWDVLHY